MSTVEGLYSWNFKSTEWAFDGWDEKQVPSLTRDNFILLIDSHNDLIDNHKELTLLVQELKQEIDRMKENMA